MRNRVGNPAGGYNTTDRAIPQRGPDARGDYEAAKLKEVGDNEEA